MSRPASTIVRITIGVDVMGDSDRRLPLSCNTICTSAMNVLRVPIHGGGLSESLQGQVLDCVEVDLVTEARLRWCGDVAAVVYVGKVLGRHAYAQYVLGHHDFGEVAVGYGEGHVQIHGQ